MKNILTNVYLFFAGLTLVMVSSYIAIATNDYLSTMSGQSTVPSISILSDLRGMGGMLLVLGFYVLLSAFVTAWQQAALSIAAIVYVSFVGFRTLSFILDGSPDITIIIAYLIETVLAALSILIIREKGFSFSTATEVVK